MKLRRLLYIAFVAALSMGVVACNDDELGETIFPEVNETLDPNSYSFQLDSFLKREYLIPYNLDFCYKMEDVGTDMNYNLVPATYDHSVELAALTKYLWFEVYDKEMGPEFLRAWGPRMIHLIGSPAFNPVNGTMILGLAEGGIKVSLFRVNYIDFNPDSLNEYYLKTMHHEFAHILHQTKTYPQEFKLISSAVYDPTGWQDLQDEYVNSMGCVTAYGSSQEREDFAEIIANYITKTDEQWEEIMYHAGRNFEQVGVNKYGQPVYSDENEEIQDDKGGLADGIDGVAIINQKVQIARTWFRDAWGLDLDALRAEVQRRQSNINIDSLRNVVYSIGNPVADTTEGDADTNE